MNARRKRSLRAGQYWEVVKARRFACRGEPVETACARCQKPFIPEWCDAPAMWGRCCETCTARNLFDGLDLPTPPELLDRFTILPTLTRDEYRRLIGAAPAQIPATPKAGSAQD